MRNMLFEMFKHQHKNQFKFCSVNYIGFSIKVIVNFSLSLTNGLSSYCGIHMLYIPTKSIVFEPRQIQDKLQKKYCHVSRRVEKKSICQVYCKKYQTTPDMRINRFTLFKCVFSQILLQSAHPCPVSMYTSQYRYHRFVS